jgi:tRNA nucleotidyltransferase (CCA-adding enzyme)
LAQTQIVASLPTSDRVSQIVQLLSQYDAQMLILVAIRCRESLAIRRQIWQYLTVWAQIKPILTGDDLRKLGYPPSPKYRLILADLLAATLDGVVTNRASAEVFIRLNYS